MLPRRHVIFGEKSPAPTSGKTLPNIPTVSTNLKQLHEPVGHANLPVHDSPCQNIYLGPDKGTPPQEPAAYAVCENVHQCGYVNVKMSGSGACATGGSDYQNIDASERPT